MSGVRPGRRGRLRLQLALALICAAATLILAESAFQLLHHFRDELEGTRLGRVNSFTGPAHAWERYFIENHERGVLVYEGLHQPHPTRGWSLRPDFVADRAGITYTTNRHGFRSLHEFTNDEDRYRIIVVGDSFTFGDDIDDAVTWPHLLQQLDDRFEVLNLAGTGYGVDQMYLTLEETRSDFRPSLVVAAFISEDLERSMLAFRDFKKPRFVIRDDRLVLTNTPIGSVDEVYEEVRDRESAGISRLRLVNVARAVGRRLAGPPDPDVDGECSRLNTKLFEAMHAIADGEGADFMLVYLPVAGELVDPDLRRWGEGFFERHAAGHDPFFFNPRPELLEAEIPKSKGHYKEAETRLLAALMQREIRKLPSWRAFEQDGAPPAR